MAKKKIFSVITVCYNEENNIEKTCKSVANQSSKDFEWIVIDGGSKDKTVSILKKYKKYMSYFTSEKDSGVFNAMNKAIRKAKGKYLLFLNGGDYFSEKNVLTNTLKFLEKDNFSADIYYGDLQYDNGEVVSYSKSKLDKRFFLTKSLSHQATFISRDLFDKFGTYDESYKIVADFEFWIKTIVKNTSRTQYLPLVISVFDQRGMSTNPKFAKRQIEERNRILLSYGLITPLEAKKYQIRWTILTIFKRIGLYLLLRKLYRRVVKR